MDSKQTNRYRYRYRYTMSSGFSNPRSVNNPDGGVGDSRAAGKSSSFVIVLLDNNNHIALHAVDT